MNRWLDAAIGGWSISSTFTLQSGNPIPIGMSLPRLADGNQRPNVTCRIRSAGISYHDRCRHRSAVFQRELFRRSGRSAIRQLPALLFQAPHGSAIRNMDAAMRKEFVLRESLE